MDRDKWLTSADIQIRYQCSRPTACKRMREMRHTEKPLMVRMVDVLAWEMEKTIDPKLPKPKQGKAKPGKVCRGLDGLYHLPRRREA